MARVMRKPDRTTSPSTRTTIRGTPASETLLLTARSCVIPARPTTTAITPPLVRMKSARDSSAVELPKKTTMVTTAMTAVLGFSRFARSGASGNQHHRRSQWKSPGSLTWSSRRPRLKVDGSPNFLHSLLLLPLLQYDPGQEQANEDGIGALWLAVWLAPWRLS